MIDKTVNNGKAVMDDRSIIHATTFYDSCIDYSIFVRIILTTIDIF